MRVFFSDGSCKETDAIDIVTMKYMISIRVSGILIKDKESKESIDLALEGVVFDGNMDLT